MRCAIMRSLISLNLLALCLMCGTCMNGYAQSPYQVDESTLALFPFDEGAGEFVKDSSTYELQGRIINALWEEAGRFGHALRFERQGAFVSITNPINWPSLLGELTVEAWVYPFSIAGGAKQIVSKSGCFQLLLWTNKPSFYLFVNNKWHVLHSEGSITPGRWYHFAAAYSVVSREMSIYVDGKKVASRTLEGLDDYSLLTGKSPITIGAYNESLEQFYGLIDEVRVSDRIRIQEIYEVELIAMNPNPMTETDQFSTQAKFIWSPEGARPDQTCYFRKSLHLEDEPIDAKFWVSADDRGTFFVNGRCLLYGFGLSGTEVLVPNLKKGENVLAIEGYNVTGPAAIILRGEIRLASGERISIFSDGSWKAASKVEESWQNVISDSDDAHWLSAHVLGNAFTAPWAQYIAASMFCTDKEIEREEDTLHKAKELVKAEEPSYCKVEYDSGGAYLLLNGQRVPPFFYRDFSFESNEQEQIRRLAQSGIQIYHYALSLSALWKGYEIYEFQRVERDLSRLLSLAHEARVILNVRLDPPGWWIQLYPQELIKYATGPAESGVDQIARYRTASLASLTWRRDTAKALEDFISYILQSPLGKRIIGCHVGYGVYTEWHYYGMAKDMPDFSKPMLDYFKNWVKTQYRNDLGSLRKAWNDPNITFDDVSIPGADARKASSCFVFRDPSREQKIIDYYRCLQDVVADAILYFGEVVKRQTQGRWLYGVYYGYYFGMPYPVEGSHLELGKVLSSPVVDYLAAPYPYSPEFRQMGGCGASRSVVDTFRLNGKLHLVEIDTRTHMATDDANYGPAYTPSDTIALLRRDFLVSFMHGQGGWLCDFAKAWYNDSHVIDAVKELRDLAQRSLSLNRSSCSEVVLVCDPESHYYFNYYTHYPSLKTLLNSATSGTYSELYHVGAPFDVVTLDDLLMRDLPDYKVYIFVDAYYLTEEDRNRIKEKVADRGKVVIWLYGSGLISPDGISPENASELMGMQIKMVEAEASLRMEVEKADHPIISELSIKEFPYGLNSYLPLPEDGPILYVEEGVGLEILGRMFHNSKALGLFAVKRFDNWTSIYLGLPFLPRELARAIYKYAGVHIYLDGDDMFTANSSMMLLHSSNGGHRRISLPKPATVYDCFNGSEVAGGRKVSFFDVDIPPRSTMCYLIEN